MGNFFKKISCAFICFAVIFLLYPTLEVMGEDIKSIEEPFPVSTWRIGTYDKGKYASSGLICQKNCRTIIGGKSYRIIISDRDISVTIDLVDKDKKFLSRNTYFSNAEFTAEENACFAYISLAHQHKYRLANMTVNNSIDNDFKMSISSISENKRTLDKVDLNTYGMWENGGIDSTSGLNIQQWDSIRTSRYLECNSDSIYKFTSDKQDVTLLIFEYDNNGKFISEKNVKAGEQYRSGDRVVSVRLALKYKSLPNYLIRYLFDEGSIHLDISCSGAYIIGSVNDIKHKVISVSSGISSSLTRRLTGDDITNIANYQLGYYQAWDNKFVESSTYGSSKILFEIDPNVTYYFNTNDSRFSIKLFQYDQNGTYIYDMGMKSLTNGSDWKASNSNIRYVRIIPNILQWGVGLDKLIADGLWCNFSTEDKGGKTLHRDIQTFDFSDISNYKSGAFSADSCDYMLDNTSICVSTFLDLNGDYSTRRFNAVSGAISSIIIEFDADGKYIKANKIPSGKKWTPDSSTKYISLSVKGGDVMPTSASIFDGIKNDEVKISLTYSTKYVHNTVMKDITAKQYVDSFNVGWNLGNSFDSHYGAWKNQNVFTENETTYGNAYVSKDLIDYVAACGFGAIRIPVTWEWNAYKDVNGNYHINKEMLDRVQDVVDYALQNNLYVMINSHFDAGCSESIIKLGQSEAQMKEVYKYCKDMWTEIAEYFKDYDEKLCFESYNEVQMYNSGFCYNEIGCAQMNIINQIFVDAVRKTGGNNKKRILSVQTYSAGYELAIMNDFVLPKDEVPNKLIAQVHTYPELFDQNIEERLISIESFAKRINAPVVVGEYSLINNYTIPELAAKAYSNFVARANKHGIRTYIWDDGNLIATKSHGVINRLDYKNSRTDFITAIVSNTAYKATNINLFNSMDLFVYKSLNFDTGAFRDDQWGTITTDINGYGIPIPDGVDFLLAGTSFTGDSELANTLKLQYTFFYDANMNLIKKYTTSCNGAIRSIPEGAKYVRLSINSSYHATTELMYRHYLDTRQMQLYLEWIDVNKNDVIPDTFDGSVINTIPTQIDSGLVYCNASNIDLCDVSSWEKGSYNYQSKVKENSENAIRSSNYIFMNQNDGRYIIQNNNTVSGFQITYYEFNKEMQCLGNGTIGTGREVKVNAETQFVCLVVGTPDKNSIYSYDSYINMIKSKSINVVIKKAN